MIFFSIYNGNLMYYKALVALGAAKSDFAIEKTLSWALESVKPQDLQNIFDSRTFLIPFIFIISLHNNALYHSIDPHLGL